MKSQLLSLFPLAVVDTFSVIPQQFSPSLYVVVPSMSAAPGARITSTLRVFVPSKLQFMVHLMTPGIKRPQPVSGIATSPEQAWLPGALLFGMLNVPLKALQMLQALFVTPETVTTTPAITSQQQSATSTSSELELLIDSTLELSELIKLSLSLKLLLDTLLESELDNELESELDSLLESELDNELDSLPEPELELEESGSQQHLLCLVGNLHHRFS